MPMAMELLVSRGRVFLKGPLSPWSGYGRDGIGLASSLTRAGYDVTVFPTAVDTPLPPEVAYLFTKPIEPPYDILIHHADPEALNLSQAQQQVAPIRIGWTMWEYLSFGEVRSNLIRPNLAGYTHFLGYDDPTCHSLSLLLPEGREAEKLIGGYEPDLWRADTSQRDWSGTFRFSMVGMLGPRKNPWAAIDAFNLLKERHGDKFDAELHLKTLSPGLHPKMEEAYPGLKIHYITWPQPMLKEFYLKTHAYVACSWGEGKNLPAIESATTGVAVLGTNYGGHQEWLREDWGYPLEFEWGEHEPGLISARVQSDYLAEKMWHVYNNRDEAQRKGEVASRTLPAMLSWDSVIERLSAKIQEWRKA